MSIKTDSDIAQETASPRAPAPGYAFAPMSVVALLGLLIAAAIIPPLAFSGFLLERTNRAQQEMVATLAEAAAGAAIQTVDRQLQGMVTTLRGLSTSNALREDSLEPFYYQALVALAGTETFLAVVDKNMQQLFNTRTAYGSPLGKASDAEPLRQSLETDQPVISDGFYGQIAKRWAFYAVVPWHQPGRDTLLLVMNQNAETLLNTLAMENLRGGWNAVIVDRKGRVLASTLMSSDVGKPFFLDAVSQQKDQSHAIVELEGKDYELISKKSDLSGWRVVLWGERDTIQRPMFRTIRLLFLGGLAMVALGGIATWLIGRQITKSVHRLSEDAHRLGAGKKVTATVYPVKELINVSQAMAEASAERRAFENEIRFLMREVAHRAKNQLTVVSSLAKQSARNVTDVEEFSESFQHRLMSLARSTDLLIAGSVAGVELRELFTVQIEPFRPTEAGRVVIEGSPFRLSLQAAQTLGLAVHEMATNAVKYGAFATRQGRLSVSWTQSEDHLTIIWREYVLRRVPASKRKGFGTQLITRMLRGALGAEIDNTFHADGIEWRFVIPVDQLRPNPRNLADSPPPPGILPN